MNLLLYYFINKSVQNNLLVPVKIRPTTAPYKTEYDDEEHLNFELPLTDNMNTIRIAELPVRFYPSTDFENIALMYI